jgi:hypothetical protein
MGLLAPQFLNMYPELKSRTVDLRQGPPRHLWP